jgi:D-alanine-D-alanine ligase
MRIGLTYDLRSDYLAEGYDEMETAEFDREDTIMALEHSLRVLHHDPERIGNAVHLVEKLVTGVRWELVFNIAEGLYGIGREAQVPAILDMYGIPYTFSDPLVMSLTLHKGMAKRVVRDAGIPTSDFFIVEKKVEDRDIIFQPPFFIKPIAEGTGKGVSCNSIVRRLEDLAPSCEAMLSTYQQPILVERYLSGREFTVGIIGTGQDAAVIGTMEVSLLPGAEQGAYSYLNKERFEEFVEYSSVRSYDDLTVKRSEEIALSAWRTLGCRDAGRVDIRCDEMGNPYFLEVNPLAGLHPEHSDLPIICKGVNLSYDSLIERILLSATERINALNVVKKGNACCYCT